MWRAECTNCEEPIERKPVRFDGQPYCCHGCVAGGPCICISRPLPRLRFSQLPSTAPFGEDREGGRVTEPLESAPADELRRLVLRAGPFEDQREMLHFAHELESGSEVADVSLVRADLDDAWFSLRSLSSSALVERLAGLEAFDVRAVPSETSVRARIARRSPAPPAEAEEPMLPPRQRYRLFRHGQAPATAAASEPGRGEENPQARVAQSDGWIDMPLGLVRPAEPQNGGVAVRARAVPEPVDGRSIRHTLICAPFPSFTAVNLFQDEVRNLRGVRATWLQRFDGGALHLAVDYERRRFGGRSLARRLREIEGFEWRLVSEAEREIYIELLPAGETDRHN